MRSLFIVSLPLAICLLLIDLQQTNGQQQDVGSIRLKRQSLSNKMQASADIRPTTVSANVGQKSRPSSGATSASATSVAMSSASASNDNDENDELVDDPVEEAAPTMKKKNSKPRPALNADASAEAPATRQPKKDARKPARRPTSSSGGRHRSRNEDDRDETNEEDDDEYCDDDDYSHGGEMFARPMRQFGRMMGDMFDRMQGLASGDYDSMGSGSNVAMASSYSGNNGDSRMSSVVRNNGRTQGLVSETRNGRTKTRRIGSRQDSADPADEYDEE